jgi:hypothetical protein
MDLVSLKTANNEGVADESVPLKPSVDPSSLHHLALRSGAFWRKVPAYSAVSEETFLDHSWQGKNSITRV